MQNYLKLIDKMVDVKTFPASLLPVIYAGAIVFHINGTLSILHMCLIGVAMMLVQAATNMINDLYDFKRKADNNLRSEEKVLVGGQITTKVLISAILGCLGSASLIGLYLGMATSWYILIVALIAGMVLFFYSAGPLPLCYTPLGELAAGMTMGFGITATSLYILSHSVNIPFVMAIPMALYISTILLTNNMCDLEGDKQAGRKTLPILIGIKNAQMIGLTHCVMLLGCVILFALNDMLSLWIIPIMVIGFPYKNVYHYMTTKKSIATKGLCMGLISKIGMQFFIILSLGIVVLKIFKI